MRIASLGVVFVCGAHSLAAQVVARVDRVISGRVVDSISGRPLPGAVIYFGPGTGEFRSGADGTFRIEGVGPRDTVIVIRQIGYVPARLPVPYSMTAAEIDVGTVALRQVATKLDRIAVEAEEVRRYPQLEDFYRRKQIGRSGFFLTPEEIERASPRKTSNLLVRSSKVVLECNDNGRWQKGAPSDCTARNRRPQGAGGGGTIRVENCELQVWLDGLPSTLGVDDVNVRDIAAIEVYNGPATVPAVFGNGHCGVVAIWTKTGRGN